MPADRTGPGLTHASRSRPIGVRAERAWGMHMNVLRTLAVVAVAGVALVAWKQWRPAGGLAAVVGSVASRGAGGESARGFVAVPMPDGLPSSGVVLFAPRDCPSDAARRAEALARALDAAHVPYVRADHAEYGNLASPEDATRVLAVMNGPVPVVYVNGRARANPTAQEVLAEYRGGREPG